VATHAGWLYLAVLLDAHSRRVVGRAIAGHRRTELALDAPTTALRAHYPGAGHIRHTDRDRQHTVAHQAALAANSLACSMSRSGDCLDNAMAERCFATRKAEPAERHFLATRAAARTAISAWIEVAYNRQHRHSALGYHAPVTFEEILLLSDHAA
jgi:transposase InsO family protein